jgi:cyclohexyl-isocyanide hydratase
MEASHIPGKRSVGLLLFPNVTQLDLTGPAQVFSKWPDTDLHLVARSLDPVPTDAGFSIVPTTTLDASPALDVICVPGGAGTFELLDDEQTLGFLRGQAAEATWVTSVCTGAFLLAAAGLLDGKRATTHWASRPLLRQLGIETLDDRVVIDGNVVTGGGVTAGIDFALTLTAQEFGEAQARRIQLALEYDPQPPFDAGSPESADPDEVDRWLADVAALRASKIDALAQRRAVR